MPTISVIVPVYNVEKYIHRCVDSILAQTFTDFELILVDDSSPDNCGKICDEYAEKDSRVTVIHKENGGVSSARNTGIDITQGKYITFVDSDDWIDKTYLEEMMASDADLVCQAPIIMDETGTALGKYHFEEKKIDVSTENLMRLLFSYAFDFTHCKRFNMGIVQKHHIRFDTSLDFAEDTLFAVQYAKYCHTIAVEDIANYRYIRYTSRETLSNSFAQQRVSMIKRANRLIADIIAGEDTPLSHEIYCKRMRGHYSYYVFRQIVDTELTAREKLDSLYFLTNDLDFMEVLQCDQGSFINPMLRRALLKKSKFEMAVFLLRCRLSKIKRSILKK